jgi:hypothetical protein
MIKLIPLRFKNYTTELLALIKLITDLKLWFVKVIQGYYNNECWARGQDMRSYS